MADEIIAEEAVNSATNIDNGNSYFPIIIESDGSIPITNSGTAAAACRITIIPNTDIMLLTIEGMSDEPIVMERIQRGQLLIIDGINREVTLDGENAFESYQGWEFPKLQPGINHVKITSADSMSLAIEYQPRYI